MIFNEKLVCKFSMQLLFNGYIFNIMFLFKILATIPLSFVSIQCHLPYSL